MDSILFVAHTEPDGSLAKISLEALNAAATTAGDLGIEWHVGLIGESVSAGANAIAGCGAGTFLAVEGADVAVSRYASDVSAVEALVKAAGATVVIAAATPRMGRCLPGVVVRTEGRIDTQVSGIEGVGDTLKIQRWYYRQRIEATLSRSGRPWFLTIGGGVFDPWSGEDGQAQMTSLDVALPSLRTQVAGVEDAAAEAQTIRPDAEILFVAGAGWTKKQADGEAHLSEAESHIITFLDKGQASLGSSKSLVELSVEGQAVLPFMTHMNQVGQTGSTPRHPKGLSTCCHGEEPHVVGWRFIRDRRAINLDANCGWAQGKADVLYVADAFEVMKEVNELLSAE